MAEEAATSVPPPEVLPTREASGNAQSTVAGAPAVGSGALADESKPATTADEPKTNGEVGTGSSTDAPAQATSTQDDTEMKDANDADKAADGPAVATPSAPAKKATASSAKRRSSGVPEHKSKKLNKKKSKQVLNTDAKPGQYYLARMKGHPWWPAIICDEEMLPAVLINSRPVTTAQPDGTYKKAEYADGGKRMGERTFPIMFLYTNEFAWMPNTDLQPLSPEDCQDVPEKGKSKSLIEAYKIAAESHDLSYFKEILLDHQEQIAEDQQRVKEREEKKAAKAKRKSDAAAAVEEVDEMDVDEDEEEDKPKSKKRKKAAESDDEGKPAKTPKTGTKLKLSAPKTPVTESAGKKKNAKSKPAARKSAARASSDDEAIDSPMVDEKPLTPAELKEKKEKEIRYCRHKLQKGFLSRDTIPSEEDTKSMSSYLTKLETYPDLEGSIIRNTKIHKVLKAMIRLQSIPMDAEYNFKKRSMELLGKWNSILQDDPAVAGDKDDEKADDKPEEKPETNGVAKVDETEAPTAAHETEKSADEKPVEEKPAEDQAVEDKAAETTAKAKPTVDTAATETAEAAPEAPAPAPVEATA